MHGIRSHPQLALRLSVGSTLNAWRRPRRIGPSQCACNCRANEGLSFPTARSASVDEDFLLGSKFTLADPVALADPRDRRALSSRAGTSGSAKLKWWDAIAHRDSWNRVQELQRLLSRRRRSRLDSKRWPLSSIRVSAVASLCHCFE